MRPDTVDQIRNLLVRLQDIAGQSDQDPGTVADLGRLVSRLDQGSTTLVVVGSPNAGKSSLINALVEASAVPVDFQVATAVPIVVRHHHESQPVAHAVVAREAVETGQVEERREPIDLARVADWATVGGSRTASNVVAVEVGLDHPLLRDGLEIIDTPGVGGLDSDHGLRAVRALERADAALMVLDAHQPISAQELDFLERAATRAGTFLFALNKIDDRPKAAWGAVLEENRRIIAARLRCAPEDVVLIPVSAADAVRSRQKTSSGDVERAAKLARSARITDLAQAVRAWVIDDGQRQRLLGTLTHCGPIVARYADDCEARLTTDAAALAEQAGRVRAAQQPGANWRTVLKQEYVDLDVNVRRIGTDAVNRRMKLLRQEVANRTAPDAVADRAVQELAAVQAELTEAVDGSLPGIVMRVADALSVDGLDGLIAEFDPRITGRTLRASISDEDARRLAGVLIQGAMGSAQAGILAYRMVLPALRTAGVAVGGAAAGAVAVEGATVGAATVTTGTALTGAAGAATGAAGMTAGTGGAVAATGGAGAGAAAAGGVVIVAGAVAVLAGVVVLAVAFHQYRVKKRAAHATAICDAADDYAKSFLVEITAGIAASARNLEELINRRLAERAAALKPDPERRAQAEKRRDTLAEIERDRIALRTELAAR